MKTSMIYKFQMYCKTLMYTQLPPWQLPLWCFVTSQTYWVQKSNTYTFALHCLPSGFPISVWSTTSPLSPSWQFLSPHPPTNPLNSVFKILIDLKSISLHPLCHHPIAMVSLQDQHNSFLTCLIVFTCFQPTCYPTGECDLTKIKIESSHSLA